MIKHTIESYSKALRKVHGDRVKLKGSEFLGVCSKQLHTCYKHGDWLVRPDGLLLGYGCPKCDAEAKRSKYRLSKKEIQHRLDKKHNGNIVAVGEYINQKTKLKFYCKNHKEYWDSVLDTVVRGKGCPKCSMNAMLNNRAFAKKKYKIQGKTYSVMGYEPFAIDYIKSKGHTESDIIIDTAKIPIVKMSDGKKHFPDIYIKSKNLLVEVKSPYTFFSTNRLYNTIRKKRKAAIQANFRYKVLLFNECGDHISLPKFWWLLSRDEIRSKLKGKCRVF